MVTRKFALAVTACAFLCTTSGANADPAFVHAVVKNQVEITAKNTEAKDYTCSFKAVYDEGIVNMQGEFKVPANSAGIVFSRSIRGCIFCDLTSIKYLCA